MTEDFTFWLTAALAGIGFFGCVLTFMEEMRWTPAVLLLLGVGATLWQWA